MTCLNVFVLGMDDINRQTLQALPGSDQLRFHPLLSVDEVVEDEHLDLPKLLDKARHQLDAFDGSVDAIVGFWDFPTSTMVPMLCQERGLPGARLEGVVKCEHKYWSRIEQSKVIREHPGFAIVDLDQSCDVPRDLSFPMWLKPVKSSSSDLAFHVEDEGEFADAVEQIRDGIDRLGKPFDFVLHQLDLPPEISRIGGRACLAEEEVSGRQVTVEGYVHDGDPRPYGVIDSVVYPDTTSFLRYQYPSTLPNPVADAMVDISRRVMRQIDLRSATFNIEFFWNADSEEICLLEVNPRHSQSHAWLFEYVDGVPNHQFMVQLALGREPEFPHLQGEYDVAAKWFLRRFEDGVVRRSPTRDEVTRVERETPGVKVDIVADEGTRLSEMAFQDSYSYELAHVHVGAADEAELREKYDRCVEALRFEFDD
jgi:biotin carboxylase